MSALTYCVCAATSLALGVGGTVAVQKAAARKAPVVRKASTHRPALRTTPRPASRAAAPIVIPDCPIVTQPSFGGGDVAGLGGGATGFPPMLMSTPVGIEREDGWVRTLQTQPSPDTSTVPEPSTWATLVPGFGLIGLISRRRPERRAGGKGGAK